MFRKKRRGSLVVEATLVLPLVIITLLFIANLLNICMVHLCMQQALNNTVKKISQDSYLVYRFAGETKYKDFLSTVSSWNKKYDEFEDKVDTVIASYSDMTKSVGETWEKGKETATSGLNVVSNFDGMQNSFGDTTKTMSTFFNTFNGDDNLIKKVENFGKNCTECIKSFNETITKAKSFATALKNLKDNWVENRASIISKLLGDALPGAVTTGISEYVFNTYVKELGVPASKTGALNPFHSELREDGSFTVVIVYLYINPFSFVNSKSMEYSVINKEIRMVNAITIKPFIGKNGTSLKK